MKKYHRFILMIAGLASICAFPGGSRLEIAAQMQTSIQKELLNVWYPKAIDNEYGGYLSTFTYDFKPIGPQEKMIVTQARHVWSNARAAELYPENASYRSNARHGFYFLRDVMWDKLYGGFYTLTDRQGNIKETDLGIKTAYGNSFAIYALAAYYQCSGDTAAFNLAKKAFAWLDRHAHDSLYKGYYQHMQREGTPVIRTSATPAVAETGYKDQNSSIHLLEALTELYKVWPDPVVWKRLHEMLFLVRDVITTKQGYLTLFFQPDWTPVSVRDSSKDLILKHHNLDYVSFGHNVETAYLMLEASETLGLKDDRQTITIAKRMVDHALKNGWDKKLGGFYDEGYYFKDSTNITIVRDTKNWWAQAEGLNSLLMMADYFPEDEMQYFEKFRMQWQYVQTYLIDHEHGDWYAAGLDKEPEMKTALKGQIWKATYHVFRALANCVERLIPDTVAPSAPQKLYAKKASEGFVLQWGAAHDNGHLLGYNIYEDDKRIGFTPLLSFTVMNVKEKHRYFEIRAIDVHGNESAGSNRLLFQ